MTIYIAASLFLSLIGIGISISAYVAVRRSLGTSLSKRLSEHSIALEELTLQLRNLRARLNMKAYRDRKNQNGESDSDPPPAQTGETWKDRMNRELALRMIPK